jgi:hypothetical protein
MNAKEQSPCWETSSSSARRVIKNIASNPKINICVYKADHLSPEPAWTGVKNLLHTTGFESRTVHPAESRYTDYTKPSRANYVRIQNILQRAKENNG